MSLDALSDKLVEQLYGKQSKGTLPVESCSGDNCGDALANFLNSGPLKDTGLSLPRGGVGPGDLAGVGKARGASVLGRGDLSLDALTPGTVIHMTRQPGDRYYDIGKTHIGIVDEDENGNKMFKSFTAGKGWRTETVDQRFIDRLPAQITATNPVNPGGGWLAKTGNLLGPSAAQAGGLPKGQGQEDDLVTRLTNQLYGEGPGQEDLATKLTNQMYGEDAKVAPAPTVPVPTKSVVPDSDYNSMLYGQDPLQSKAEEGDKTLDNISIPNIAEQIKARNLALDPIKQKIEESKKSLEVQQKVLDKTSQSAVDAFNVSVKDHNNLIKQYNSIGETPLDLTVEDKLMRREILPANLSIPKDPFNVDKDSKRLLKQLHAKPKDLATQYHESMLGLVSSIPGVPSLGPPPPGGYDEMGNRLDAEGRSFTPARPDTLWTQAVDRLEGLGKDIIRIGKDPHSAIVGAAELGWDIGTFGLGLVGATAKAIEYLPAGIMKMANGEASVLDAYNVMKDQFQSMAELTDPGKQWMKKALGLPADAADSLVRALGGTPLERKGPSEAVGEAVMLPLTMTNSWFQGVADEIHNSEYPMPNTEGLLRFMGEGTGFFVMAKFHQGGIRGLKKGMDVLGKEINEFRGLTSKGFARGPDMDAAWARLAEAKAGEVEGIATEIAKEFDPNRPIIDDVQVAGEEAVKKAEVVEEVPVVEEPKPKPLTAVERARAKKVKEVKVEPIKVIDETTTGTPHWDNLMKKGEGQIEYMSPDEYISRVAQLQGLSIEESLRAVPEELPRDYAERMSQGEKAPLLILDMVEKSQEGRARALAAKQLGVQEIPVLVRKVPLATKDTVTLPKGHSLYRSGEALSTDIWEFGPDVTYYGGHPDVSAFYGTPIEYKTPKDYRLFKLEWDEWSDAKDTAARTGVPTTDGNKVFMPDGKVFDDLSSPEFRKYLSDNKYDGVVTANALEREGGIGINLEKANIVLFNQYAKKIKVVPTPPERTIIETDPQTSSLRQDPEVTRVRAQAFDERTPRDLLSIHAKALNDVNRWLDGDPEVSIEPVRRLLSDLAAKVEDPAHDRTMLDMLGTPREVELFKKISKESATWARRVKREKVAKVKEVVPEVMVEEPAPKVNNLPSIEQKLEAPGVAEGKVKELADNEAWKQAEVDAEVVAEVTEATRYTQEAIEKHYGKSVDELSDAELISYISKGKGGGTELYSGIPVHLIGKAIRNFFGKKEDLPGHEDFKLAMGAKKPDGKYQWRVLGLNSKTGKWDELSVFDTKKEARTNSIQRGVDASVEWTKAYRDKLNDPLMQPEQAIALKKAERTDRRYDEMKAFKEGDFSKWWDSRKKWWGEAIHDQAGRVRSALLKHFGEGGQRLLSYIESVPGGARYGEEKFRQMTKEVYDGLSKNLTEVLDRYHMYKRFADIWSYNPDWKAPNGIKRDETMLNVLNFKERNNLSDADFKLIQERSELMFNHARGWVDEFLLDTGIIGPEEAKALKSHDYSKMKYLQTYADVFDRSTTSKVGDVKVSNYDSGVDPLGHGGASIAEVDQRIVYNEIARRMAGRAANQRSRQAMREFATQFPDNGMIWHKGIEGTKKPKGWVKDYVWDFETPVESVETSYPSRQPIWLHPDFARQVATVGADMSYRFAWATKLLGTDLVRSLAVGTSAVWATVVNLPIDIMHTFFSPRIFKDGKEVGVSEAKAIYSPFFPKYLAELGSNYIDVASDVWNRGPKYDAYAKYGGLLQFLTQRQSHITGHMQRPGKFDQLLDILSAHGRNTELLTRVSIMDRVIEQKAGELGITKDELWKRENARPESEILRLAAHVARENMPYGQTGWMVKVLDRFIPFAGANYVGGKTFWRAAVERPADFSARIANIGATAVGITAMSLLYNPKAYREISDNDKERNIVIPFLPDYLKFKDSKGEERTWNMKIPGTGGPMFFYNLFAGLTHKFMYEAGMTNIPPSYESIIKSLAQNAPVQSMAPPVISALTSYVTNYSVWQDRNLFTKLGGKTFSWPQSKAEGINDPNVAQLAKTIGGATGLSPTRLQGAVGELIPKNNEFMWLFGKTYEGLFSGVPEKIQERVWQETIVKTPGVNRLFSLNTPDAYRQTGDASRGVQEEKVEMRNYLRKSEFDLIMEEKARGGDVRDKLRAFYRTVGKEDPEAMQRFMDDSTKLAMIEKMEHKSIWKGMLGKSDELKAMDFNERLKVESSPEEQKSLRRELGRLMAAGFVGEKFFPELGRIRRKDKK